MAKRGTFFLLTAGLLLVASASTLVAQECDVRRFGGPNKFHDGHLNSVDDLQALFSEKRADIINILGQVGWAGDADDLFASVASGQGITLAQYDKGQTIQWMAFREKGQPAAKTNKCWGGAKPFEAWTFSVESNGRRWRFAVPKICGNVSLLGSQPLPSEPQAQAPVCRISATCQGSDFSVSTSGSAGDMKVSYVSPSGKTTAYTGPFEPSETGDYTFIVEGSRDGLTCKEEITKASCAPPQLTCDIDLSAASVQAKDEFTVRVNAGPSGRADSVVLSATLDGESLVSESLSSPFAWTGSLKKPGTYSFSATASGDGQTSNACTATLEVLGPDTRWVWRLFGSYADGDDEQDTFAPDGERRYASIDAGAGLGTSLEWLPNSWFGLEAGLSLFQQEVHFMWDTATVWGMDEDEPNTFVFTLGPNFHLTPDSRADFYIGPFVSYLMRDNVSFSDQGFDYRYSLDDETGFGAQLGLDVPVCTSGRCWTFHSSLKWLEMDSDLEYRSGPSITVPSDFELDLSPIILSIGAGYRF